MGTSWLSKIKESMGLSVDLGNGYVARRDMAPFKDESKNREYFGKLKELVLAGVNVALIEEIVFGTHICNDEDEVSMTPEMYYKMKKVSGNCIYNPHECSVAVDASKDDSNVNTRIKKYLSNLDKYLEELQRRALAPQAMYDKLVSDYHVLFMNGFIPNGDANNFYFDSEQGFMIGEVQPKIVPNIEKYDVDVLYKAVMGIGRPVVYIGQDVIKDLDQKRLDIYASSYSMVITKLNSALEREFGLAKVVKSEDVVVPVVSNLEEALNEKVRDVRNKKVLGKKQDKK